MKEFHKPMSSGLQSSAKLLWVSLGMVILTAFLTSYCSPQKKPVNNRSSNSIPGTTVCEDLADSASCGNASNCQWTGSLCSGDAEYCARFLAQNNCPVSCQWNLTTSSCQPLPMQSVPPACNTYTSQQMCSQYTGCIWNGYNCIASSGSVGPTTGTPYPTTGNPYPNTGSPYPTTGSPYPTTGSPYPTTGNQAPTTSGQAPVTFCATMDWWQCLTTQGCRLAVFPSFSCVPMPRDPSK